MVFLWYLSSVVITENNGWRKVLIYLKSQLISDSFCVFFPLNSKAKKERKKSGIERLYLKTGYNSPKMFGFFLKANYVHGKLMWEIGKQFHLLSKKNQPEVWIWQEGWKSVSLPMHFVNQLNNNLLRIILSIVGLALKTPLEVDEFYTHWKSISVNEFLSCVHFLYP